MKKGVDPIFARLELSHENNDMSIGVGNGEVGVSKHRPL